MNRPNLATRFASAAGHTAQAELRAGARTGHRRREGKFRTARRRPRASGQDDDRRLLHARPRASGEASGGLSAVRPCKP